MAAFHILYIPPSTSHFSNTHRFLPSPPPNHHLLSLSTNPHSPSLQLFLVKDNVRARARARAQALPSVQSESTEEKITEEDDVTNKRLVVQNVPWTCTVNELRPLLKKYGNVVHIEFAMYNKTKNRGLAFVTMGSHEEALAALKALDSTEFEGRVLKLNWANPKKAKAPSPPPRPKPMPVHNLFVANLPFEARAKDLKEFFNAENGNVVSAEVIFQDNPRRSLGYGFVSFNTKAEADAALAAFEEKEFMGRPMRLSRSKRFLREETKATIEAESAQEET